ncbi:MAG: S8 family serine peptidase [bacterium]
MMIRRLHIPIACWIGVLMCALMGRVNGQGTDVKYWVFFKDKGYQTLKKEDGLSAANQLGISQRAIQRRDKVRKNMNLIDESDLPVVSEYIKSMEALGLRVDVVSRWLNGISVVIPEHQVDLVRRFPFVRKIQRVGKSLREPEPQEGLPKGMFERQSSFHAINYGISFQQNNQIRVPQVHDLGITGRGVFIGMIDTGFDYKNRTVFTNLDVKAEHDFHWNDSTTANEDGDSPGQHNHGTQILSVIAGFHEGQLIGPAYGASYALAKSEWVPSETRVEEDDWVAAIEWLEGLGVDVVSSSVGYSLFDGGVGYTIADMDGNTCTATIAADIAASKGVVVVSSAGNERNNTWKYITSPADGDSVIAVGAVNSNGILTYFSSVGPTSDGRTKPDVVAMGSDVRAVYPSGKGSDEYVFVSGTSLSCPLVAGVCALVLEAHPELGPMDVRDAIRNTADRANNPDSLYGWGLVNAYEAIFYQGMIFRNFEWTSILNTGLKEIDLDILYKHGVRTDSVTLSYTTFGVEDFEKVGMVYLWDGFRHRFSALLPPTVERDAVRIFIEAVDSLGIKHLGPLGAPEIVYSFSDTLIKVVPIVDEVPEAFQLYQNYPNPFNSETTISFYIEQKAMTSVKIYNLLGQEVITLVDAILDPGKNKKVWNGFDAKGNRISSGIYFCVVQTESQRRVCKMLLVH